MRSDTCHSLAALFGRLALSAIFVLSGFNKITNWSATADQMAQQGMMAVPLLLAGAVAFELLGGLSLLLGFYGRVGATLLIAFLIPTTVIFHDFWAVDPAQQQNQMIHFMKNIAILGGLLMVVAHGTGRYSLDRRVGGTATGARPAPERYDEPAMVG
jgi:putative oxidoreductase